MLLMWETECVKACNRHDAFSPLRARGLGPSPAVSRRRCRRHLCQFAQRRGRPTGGLMCPRLEKISTARLAWSPVCYPAWLTCLLCCPGCLGCLVALLPWLPQLPGWLLASRAAWLDCCFLPAGLLVGEAGQGSLTSRLQSSPLPGRLQHFSHVSQKQ